MEREQFKTLVKGMKAVYSDVRFIEDKDAFDVWYSLLQDLDYNMASAAIQKYMLSNKFPPAIADIREQYDSLTAPQELNEMEAWALVQSAICNSGYNSVDEFAKLPQTVQKAVGTSSQLREWALTENLNREVIMSNFQRAYSVECQRHKELQKIPQNIRALIEKANIGSYPAKIEQERQDTIERANEKKQGGIKALESNTSVSPPPIEKLRETKRRLSGDV